MVTCGLSHIGDPESDEYGERGIHGNISNQPAEVIEIVQPDPFQDQLEMRISGIVKESSVFGPHLVLKRTISSTMGKTVIRINDEVTNRGNEPAPHMILYHCNFGWPLADEGTSIFWEGNWQSGGRKMDNQIFFEGGGFKTCPGILEMHRGSGEAVAYIDIKPDKNGICNCGLVNSNLKLAIELRFRKEQLPWLTNWQHWAENEYVTGLEPGTNPPVGQSKARDDGNLIFLDPGESRVYDVELEIMNDDEKIKDILQ